MGDPQFNANRATSRPHVVISGYYGFDNLGDELILQTLVNYGQAHDYRLTVLSANPESTSKRYSSEDYQIEAIGRMDPKAILKALWNAHLFISGGGGLFQDSTGWKSPVYYGGLILLARYLAVPTMIFGQGVGPLTGRFARWFTGQAMEQAQTILVRDQDSATLLRELLPEAHPITVTTDPVWTLDFTQAHLPETSLPEASQANYRLGVSLREWPNLRPEGLKHLAQTLAQVFLAQKAENPSQKQCLHLLVFQEAQDKSPLAQFADAFGAVAPDVEIQWVFPDQVCQTLPHLEGLIAMRFHGVLLALLAGIPVFTIPYAPKVAHLNTAFDLEGLPPEALAEFTTDMLPQGLPKPLSSKGKAAVCALKAQAQQNFTAIEALLMGSQQQYA